MLYNPNMNNKIISNKPVRRWSQKNKKLCLKRDKYRCVNCGSKNNLNVHHIDNNGPQRTNSPNNNLDNLQTLCYKCHLKIHFKIDKDKDKEIIDMREIFGCTWTSIGKTYGMTRQGAQDYYKRAKKRQDAKPEHWSIKVRRMVVKIKQGLKN